MIREIERRVAPGGAMLFALLAALLVLIGLTIVAAVSIPPMAIVTVILGVTDIVLLTGLFTVAPNEARVLQLFGRYVGTVREPGWKWGNPFYTKRKISTRIRNF